MKLIDQTPLQDEEGKIGILQRVQGTLKYGFNWYPELEAQKAVLPLLSKGLGKGYTVIRNRTLGGSGITIPLTLVGPAGIYAIHVTHLRGTYEAKVDGWGAIYGTNYRPAAVNLPTLTQLYARALKAYLEFQGVTLPQPVEPIILAADPGMHIEAIRPVVRIILVDGIERWAKSIASAPPVLTVETAYELADRIVNPRIPKKEKMPAVPKQDTEKPEPSRAGAIFQAADEAEALTPEELEFALEQGENLDVSPGTPMASAPAKDTKRRILGMTVPQLALVGGMFLVEICVLIGFSIVIFGNQ